MIANTDDLPGVPVDVNNYYEFFTSPDGGHWCDEEIDILYNPTRHRLLNRIDKIAEADYDYLITIFTGHGEEAKDGTVLAINGEDETITLDDLTNLSQKQLLIIDCCRGIALMPKEKAFQKAGATMLSMSRDPIRQAYEDRIMAASPQEIILFACEEGEPAGEDPEDGGAYSYYLLRAVRMVATNSHSPFVSVSRAHRKAASLMRRDPSVYQHPQILQSCYTDQHQRLPLAINPNLW